MDIDPPAPRLRQELEDERAEREAAQRKAAQVSENAALWRRRAEERTERIERLEAERDQLRSFSGWLRARVGRPMWQPAQLPPPTGRPDRTATHDPAPGPRPMFPSTSVMAVGVGNGPVRSVLTQFDLSDHADADASPQRADFVVWDPAVVAPSDVANDSAFSRWLSSEGTQPLVILTDGRPVPVDTRRRVIRARREWCTDAATAADWVFPMSFDANLHSPSRRLEPADLPAADWAVDGAQGELLPIVRETADLRRIDHLLAAAACVPITLDGEPADTGVRRQAASLRRTVHRDHAPWIVASQLLDVVGIAHRSARQSVAGVLVSNRPARVTSAALDFLAQTYPDIHLVVACQGFDATPVRQALAAEGSRPVDVLELSGDARLGTCLNAAIAATTSEVIAKIDDDDHYGSGYIEDAAQAILYSGAELISKGAVFTYLESTDTTVLRRPDLVERFYRGSPNGASMVFSRQLWDRVRFPDRTVGEDVAFSKGALRLGVLPYATSPWEFVYRRSISGNTWQAVDEVFLEGSTLAWEGDHPELADLEPS